MSKKYLKNFLLSDWIKKKFLLNSKYFSRDIKHELISNYFINKVFARRFKGFDSLAYEPKFKLELFPYSNNNYWKAYKFIFLTYLFFFIMNLGFVWMVGSKLWIPTISYFSIIFLTFPSTF